MKRNIIISSIIFIVISVFLTISIYKQNTQKYYCPQEVPGNYNENEDIYNPKDDCSTWKDEYIQKHYPNGYSTCLKNKENAKNKYKNGKCTPIIIKKHKSGNAVCLVEIPKKGNRVISTTCYGKELDKKKEKLLEHYKGWDGI